VWLACVDAKSVSQVVQKSLGVSEELLGPVLVPPLPVLPVLIPPLPVLPVLIPPLPVESSRKEVWEGWDLRLTSY